MTSRRPPLGGPAGVAALRRRIVDAMVRRFEVTPEHRIQDPEWVDRDSRASHLFAARLPLRKIVVMIDAELLGDDPTGLPTSRKHLLAQLLQHDLVRLYRYADDGPPPEVPATPGYPDLYAGWAVLAHRNAELRRWDVVYESAPGTYSVGGVMGNAVDIAGQDDEVDAYCDLGPEEAAARRRADVLAAQVASQALGADLYVTERTYLQTAGWRPTRGLTACTVADALPLLGLYFRAQDEYPVALRHSFHRGLFFWVGVRELVPEAWRWFTACVQHGTGALDDSLDILAGSLLQRVQRALEARDAVHLALNRPQNNDTQQNALSHLDTTLVFLMGAIDVAARVAHRVLGMPATSEHRAGWQRQRRGDWLAQVRAVEPALASVVGPGSRGAQVLTITRLLRNSVHGAALQGLAVVNGVAPMESLVGLPADDEANLLGCMDAVGGRASWGTSEAMPHRVHMDPGVFVDRLFDEVVVLLNDLMAKTPVERLLHVSLSTADCQPPSSGEPSSFGDPFQEWIRTSIRWQLGL